MLFKIRKLTVAGFILAKIDREICHEDAGARRAKTVDRKLLTYLILSAVRIEIFMGIFERLGVLQRHQLHFGNTQE